MNTFQFIVALILMITYSVFSVWAICKFRKLSTGIPGTIALASGGIGLYFLSPLIASLILILLKAILIIGVILLILGLLGG